MKRLPAQSRSLSFFAPLPYSVLSPNARVHPLSRARAAKRYRFEVGAYALEAMGRQRLRFEQAWLDLEFVFRLNRKHDDDNLAASWKSGRDSLADIGLVPADDTEHLCIRRLLWRKAKPDEQTGVFVTVEEMQS